MRGEAVYTTVRTVSAHSVVTDDHAPWIVVLVAGERRCAETAIHNARQLYPGRRFVFICEPPHWTWLSQCANDRVFVIEQPFNPFGQRASDLLKNLETARIEACALVIAEVGLESLRFRIFALRLRTEQFLLLDGSTSAASKQVSRFSFAVLAGVTLLLGRLRKIGRWILVHLFTHGGRREFKDRLVRRLSVLLMAHTAELHRSHTATQAGARSRIHRKVKSALVFFGTKYLDKHYRRIFQHLLDEYWGQWFDSRNFAARSVTSVIGTLGPGGSERQAVTTILGLASLGYRDLSLLCHYLDGYVDSFYLHLLKDSPISVSQVSEDFRNIDGTDQRDEASVRAGLQAVMDHLPPELQDIACYTREFLKAKPEVVHAWLDYTNVRAGLAAAIVGIPRIVLSTRSVAPDKFALFQPYMREAYRILAERPNVCLLNNSEAGARDYEGWLGLPHGKFKVIRNGFDFSALEPSEKIGPAQELRARLGIPAHAPVIGSVLRFSEEKQPFLWIDVAARIAERRRDAMFLLVGDGPLREEVHQYARLSGIADRIAMPGYQKDAALAIAAMEIFLLTSRMEGLPNVLIEAQALGVPVVTTDVGGAAETLIPGLTGYAVRPHSADFLADAVLQILGDPAWCEAARKAAQEFVRARFSVSAMTDRTLGAYFARGEFAEMPAAHQSGSVMLPPVSSSGLQSKAGAAAARFEFGQNWKKYIKRNFSQDKVDLSKKHLLSFLRRDDLRGLTFIDIGCGSGLHSLAAIELGAAEVTSFDIDPKSVQATSYLYKHAGQPTNWKIIEGSVLDEEFMTSLPKADIVYSWGVLHHTGDVWRAMRNAAVPVKKEGFFYIALYSADVHKNSRPEFWLEVKQRYLAASAFQKRKMELWYIWRFQMGYKVSALPKVLRNIVEHKKKRGMSYLTDIRDWLGGWPMEFCYDDDVKKFVTRELGMDLVNIRTGEANTEFIFKRP